MGHELKILRKLLPRVGRMGEMGMMAKKCRVSFEDDENVLKLIMEMEEK